MDMWLGAGERGQYIHQLHVTDEYSFIFLSTEEYIAIYSSTLYSMVFVTDEYFGISCSVYKIAL
jgi:hypothetical protein